ncbi:DUF1538 domain-containing protein [Enterococcus sp. MJM12]|uniref:DUF1538 domain-containing protein n=1 Tax=Candidatus Enterococcus myersii TaxID=2815322 RepID=A0ABS3H958_9ENTE|nr:MULTISPECIES: DUF1538 domain-containing protein [Enterococcus]MBO0449983.1 DUF1538 domain-containing protein [Enterococcus sp. MJM12]MCD1023331.1 DUF1538 domain-containing protein [Enterococcus sp. SMC-9]MDT2738791.1 DUF1538 domain-containing protein [Enterococcus canintestini]WHA08154.1 DUF1538 domain-containing protein [Enterococcus montenegrensis]
MIFLQQVFTGFTEMIKDVLIAIFPIVFLFVLLNFTSFKLSKKKFSQILKGFLITTVGLILFLHGVNIAYVPVGQYLGSEIAQLDYNWILIPLGFLMGFLVGFAEPAIHVMVKQVEEESGGTVRGKVLLAVVSLGIGAAVSLSMWRLLAGFSLYYFLIPGYIAVFILGRKVDKMFLAMAFDNGGVATGPMCSTFILSMAVAIAAEIEGRSPLIDGFGVVALIALTPILSTLALGYIYKKRAEQKAVKMEAEK